MPYPVERNGVTIFVMTEEEKKQDRIKKLMKASAENGPHETQSKLDKDLDASDKLIGEINTKLVELNAKIDEFTKSVDEALEKALRAAELLDKENK